MALLARDQEPHLAEGRGEFEIVSDREFRYRLVGNPVDTGHMLRAITRQRHDQYDPLHRFRLVMKDKDGQDWMGGWTVPTVDPSREPWLFTGTCKILSTDVNTECGGCSGAEVRFLIPRDDSASLVLGRFVKTSDALGNSLPYRTVDVLGTQVTFAFDYATDVLTLSAPSTDTLPAHLAENWLGEPLRILFGQLVFPRLVERRFSNGQSMLSLRQSPRWTPISAWTALWIQDDRLTDQEGFFDLYRGLLTLVAKGRQWESHTVTGYYEEVIQASRGS